MEDTTVCTLIGQNITYSLFLLLPTVCSGQLKVFNNSLIFIYKYITQICLFYQIQFTIQDKLSFVKNFI